jgi:hypothetical protein
VPRSPGIAGSGVAPGWLEQYLLWVNRRQLLAYDRSISLVGQDDDILGWHYSFKTLHRELQKAAPRTQEINKLFRLCLPTIRPESAAHTTTHYNTKSIFVHFPLINKFNA